MEPPFGGKGGRRGSVRVRRHTKDRWWFPIDSPSTVTVALSVTIRPQFAIECLQHSNQQGGGSLWAKISGYSPWSRPPDVGVCRERTPHAN